jgi:hypothetical protein
MYVQFLIMRRHYICITSTKNFTIVADQNRRFISITNVRKSDTYTLLFHSFYTVVPGPVSSSLPYWNALLHEQQ